MVHNKSGQFKLGDFGIARKLEGLSTSLSQRYTPKYMAPEVATNPYYDSRVDIYSLGVMLYQLLNAMRIPFQESTQINSMRDIETAIRRRTSGDPLPRPSNASEAMTAVILKACAFDPKDRFATASEMKTALMSVANGTYRPPVTPDQTTAVRRPTDPNKTVSVRSIPQPPKEEKPSHHKSTKVIAIIGTILLIALIAIAGYFIANQSQSKDDHERSKKTFNSSSNTTQNDTEPEENPTTLTTEPTTEPIVSTTEPTEPEEDPTVPGDYVNPAYAALFDSYGMEEIPGKFPGMDTMTFALLDEEYDMIETLELGYIDDVVCEMIDTFYLYYPDATYLDMVDLDESMHEAMSTYIEFSTDYGSFIEDTYYVFYVAFPD